MGLVGIDAYKNEGITVRGCGFLHTGGSGFVPNKSRNVLVEGCTFNHTGSSQDDRMWKRGSGLWPFDCQDVVIQENRFLNAHGPGDSYGAHIDYGNENVVLQYNFSYHNEGDSSRSSGTTSAVDTATTSASTTATGRTRMGSLGTRRARSSGSAITVEAAPCGARARRRSSTTTRSL